MNSATRIYVAGHTGLIGSAVVRQLVTHGYGRILLAPHHDLELGNWEAVCDFFKQHKPQYVVLAAGKVGGIMDNNTHPADFITNNLLLQLNVLRAAHQFGVEKLIFFGSSCMYPRDAQQPMAESQLLSGRPEDTSLSYAIAKLAGVQMCAAFNQQYGDTQFITVIPNSVYGPHDCFDLTRAHVLASLLKKIHRARVDGAETVSLWGSGAPKREFIYADDVANACIFLLEQTLAPEQLLLNLGVGEDYSIAELANKISQVTGYQGQIQWDSSKPDGAPRKLLDSSRLMQMGWRPKVNLTQGLEKTYAWFLKNGATCQAVPH